MVPKATANLRDDLRTSRSSVYPAKDADARLQELWTRHGDPQSDRYTNPDLISLPSLVRYNALTYPAQIAYLVPKADNFDRITWQDFDVLTDLCSAHYAEAFSHEISTSNATSSQPTIALLGTGNTFEYWVTQIGLCKLGVRLLLLSDKNADVARDHLLQVCNATGIVIEQRLAKSWSNSGFTTVTIPSMSHLRASKPSSTYAGFESVDVWNQHAMIIHSSGSTGLPKPIIHTNRSLMLIARMYRLFQSFNIENWYNCFPLYHIAGVSIILGGLPSALSTSFPPENWPPSPGAMLSAWRKLETLGHPVDCLHCAPSVIEDLYEYMSLEGNLEYSPFLRLKILQPGGAALSPVLLRRLTDMGINVKTTYGSTEIGPPFRTIPDTRDNAKCYNVRTLFPDSSLVRMEPQGDGLFECVVYKGFALAAELWPTPDAPNPYRTNDLFLEDPPGSGLFVLQGRKDDIIVHSNGEKTNALPLQMAIEECHSAISKAVVFGTDYPCTSAIIQLSEEGLSGHGDILRSIEQACKAFPAYSQVDQSMTVILPRGKMLPVTPKGNVRRKEAWKLYGAEIEELYTNQANGEPSDVINIPASDLDDTAFVRHCVARVSSSPIQDVTGNISFYDLGLNSQMAVRLRPQLAHRFGKFPLMYIFEYPSVSKLTEALSRPGHDQSATSSSGPQFAWIQNTITRYTSEIQSWSKPEVKIQEDKRQVIYLTGATGVLGNALIAELVTNPNVSKLYCGIRGANSRERLADQLRARGYDGHIAASDKLITVAFDMSDHILGLDQDQYFDLAAEVTTVVHNAWKMDFNQKVDMFEKDCLRSSLNLLRFCQAVTGKRFIFTSSVATNMGKDARRSVEETPIANNPALALETGYAQSKFIVERITQEYARITGSPVQICRVGQLCGHTTLGSWNTSEMFPIMIATGLKYLNAMPTFDKQTVDWLPVDICAKAINTLISTPMSDVSYALHNLVNPSTISWSGFLSALEHAFDSQFERIDMREWVARLQDLSEKVDDVPGAKLLGFFENMVEEEQATPQFETSKTVTLVPRLRDCKAVDGKLLKLYMERWRADGFLT
ncbi:male sterility protein [Aureobasidium pullulans]|nr:male sterility protein [Aureobasidium pullulans]